MSKLVVPADLVGKLSGMSTEQQTRFLGRLRVAHEEAVKANTAAEADFQEALNRRSATRKRVWEIEASLKDFDRTARDMLGIELTGIEKDM